MEYRITEKDAFTVIGVSKVFKYDTAFEEIPKFWTEHFQTVKGQTVCRMYGVCLEAEKGKDEFEYLIADNYKPWMDTPDGYVTKIIPKHTWAVFACKGALPKSLQEVNRKIFSDWLPGCKEYEIASGVNIEMYSNPDDFPQGNQDANFYSEIWIPVRKK
jgi:AraC family transcriptional regulator